MENYFIFSKFKHLFSSLLNVKDNILSKFCKPLLLQECNYEPLFLNNCKKILDNDILYIRISHLLAYTVFGLSKTTLERNEQYHAQQIKNISLKTLKILRYKIIKSLGRTKLYNLNCSQIVWIEALSLKSLQKRNFFIEKITKEEIIGNYEMIVDHLEPF